MKIQSTDMNTIESLIKQLNLNSRFLKNVLDGINEEESQSRINGQVNHLRWIAGHLLISRYRNAFRLGAITEAYPHMDMYVIKDMTPPNGRPLDESISYPHLEETLQYWESYSEKWLKKLRELTEEQLLTPGPFSTPIGDNTLLDVLSFIPVHEAYHIGQMSVIRKSLGHKAMVIA